MLIFFITWHSYPHNRRDHGQNKWYRTIQTFASAPIIGCTSGKWWAGQRWDFYRMQQFCDYSFMQLSRLCILVNRILMQVICDRLLLCIYFLLLLPYLDILISSREKLIKTPIIQTSRNCIQHSTNTILTIEYILSAINVIR